MAFFIYISFSALYQNLVRLKITHVFIPDVLFADSYKELATWLWNMALKWCFCNICIIEKEKKKQWIYTLFLPKQQSSTCSTEGDNLKKVSVCRWLMYWCFYLSSWSSNSPWRSQCHTVCCACVIIIVNWQRPNLQGFSETQVTDHCLQEQPCPKGLVWQLMQPPEAFDGQDYFQKWTKRKVFSFIPGQSGLFGTCMLFCSVHVSHPHRCTQHIKII